MTAIYDVRASETASGRASSLEELYAVHAPEALRLAYLLTGDRTLAEDLSQEAFVRVIDLFGAYSGPRLAIDADGVWRNFVLGGD